MFHVMVLFDCCECGCPVVSMLLLVVFPVDSGVRIKVNIENVVSMLAAFASLCTATPTKQYRKVKHTRAPLLKMLQLRYQIYSCLTHVSGWECQWQIAEFGWRAADPQEVTVFQLYDIKMNQSVLQRRRKFMYTQSTIAWFHQWAQIYHKYFVASKNFKLHTKICLQIKPQWIFNHFYRA